MRGNTGLCVDKCKVVCVLVCVRVYVYKHMNARTHEHTHMHHNTHTNTHTHIRMCIIINTCKIHAYRVRGEGRREKAREITNVFVRLLLLDECFYLQSFGA